MHQPKQGSLGGISSELKISEGLPLYSSHPPTQPQPESSQTLQPSAQPPKEQPKEMSKEQTTKEQPKGTLTTTEAHPAAYSAMEYLKSLKGQDLIRWQESFASCAIAGNRLAEICSETMRRIVNGDSVSDRYLLGLVWTIFRKDLKDSAKNSKE